MNAVKVSRFLSLVLRHAPERIGIRLDEAGWTDVSDLIAACGRNGVPLSREQLADIVAQSDKQRFAFDETGLRIRANQGHSVPVELGYAPAPPPNKLYHGTVAKFVADIRSQGLLKGRRHHVHLSADEATAAKVGQRRGAPVLLVIDTAAMQRAGHQFFLSANSVWLTDHVPPRFIVFPRS